MLKQKSNIVKGVILIVQEVIMEVEGKTIALSSWKPSGEQIWQEQKVHGWRVYEKYSKWHNEGDNVSGYRIMIHRDGEYYSPFVTLGQLEERTQKVGTVNYDKGNGLYFFTDRDVAENYLKSLIVKTQSLMLGDTDYQPTGELVMHKVEGIASGKGMYGDEGERMKEMYIHKKPLISIKYSELLL